MAIQQVSVFVQNKPGALSAICKLLAESGVDMRAMFISDTKEFSILRLIADDTEKAAEVLRDQNCIVSINPVIGVQSTTDFFHSFTTALRMSTHTHTRIPANAFCTAGRCAKF